MMLGLHALRVCVYDHINASWFYKFIINTTREHKLSFGVFTWWLTCKFGALRSGTETILCFILFAHDGGASSWSIEHTIAHILDMQNVHNEIAACIRKLAQSETS